MLHWVQMCTFVLSSLHSFTFLTYSYFINVFNLILSFSPHYNLNTAALVYSVCLFIFLKFLFPVKFFFCGGFQSTPDEISLETMDQLDYRLGPFTGPS